MEKVFTLKCDCYDIGLHDVKVLVDKDSESVYIYTSMCHYIPWYKRLWCATKYVLGIDNTYVDYKETFMESEDFKSQVKEILEYIEK